ncbi:hypothetical protein B2J93_3352 [Marssonina coronariae]|uniref:Uncharacterized protein n=1 Tax=Diplocarpon coronariae TaxID=2795749 RepID=A0A218Z8E0_9HELO|nr:hypothetical protein B2J93_3352 [Marssonina coronariae]
MASASSFTAKVEKLTGDNKQWMSIKPEKSHSPADMQRSGLGAAAAGT